MGRCHLLDGDNLMTPVAIQDGKIVLKNGAIGIGTPCCCSTACNPCPDGQYLEEFEAVLTISTGVVVDTACPALGDPNFPPEVHNIVFSLLQPGLWNAFIDKDGDGVFDTTVDYGLSIWLGVDDGFGNSGPCKMLIATNLFATDVAKVDGYAWPLDAGAGCVTECGPPPDGALPAAESPYCRPPVGEYSTFLYLGEPGEGTACICENKYCLWTLEIL